MSVSSVESLNMPVYFDVNKRLVHSPVVRKTAEERISMRDYLKVVSAYSPDGIPNPPKEIINWLKEEFDSGTDGDKVIDVSDEKMPESVWQKKLQSVSRSPH